MVNNWIEQYRRDGYVILEGVVDPELIEAHLRACEDVWRRYGVFNQQSFAKELIQDQQKLLSYNAEMYAIHHEHDDSLRLCLAPGLRGKVQELFGEEPIMSDADTLGWAPRTSPHTDTVFVFHDPPEHYCRTWCALEDIHPESGMFYVIPGTNKTVRFEVCDEVLEEHPEFVDLLYQVAKTGGLEMEVLKQLGPLFQCLRKKILSRVENMPRVPLALKRGDVAIFDPGIIHGTQPCTGPVYSRKSMVLDWRTRSVHLYPTAAYFGARYDYRRPENCISDDRKVVRTVWGDYLKVDGGFSAVTQRVIAPLNVAQHHRA